MKSVMSDKKVVETEITFPVLMRCVGKRDGEIVVLFTDYTCGVRVVYEDDPSTIGMCDDDWALCTDTDVWEKYNGSVTLSND